MRILDLNLHAVGPFTGVSLDLSAGNRGLHIIYGPNEAGKSSALRAIQYAFFGFPTQLDDAFVHPYASLRIGASICNDQNEELKFLRRKATKNSLRALDDATVVPDDDLRRFLGYIDQNLFKTFFGIDHAMLVHGGQDIVQGQGDVARILFSGGGVSELHTVLKSLDFEMQALFLSGSRARKPRLNELLSKLEAARKTTRDSQLPHRQWDDQRKALERDLRRKTKAEEELEQFSSERNRLERVHEALSLIANRADLLPRRTVLAAVPTLPPDFRERRQQIEQNVRLAEAQHTRAFSTIRSLSEQIGTLDISESLLNERDVIEPIKSRLGVYQQAQGDRPGLEAELRRLEDDASDTLRKINQSLVLSDAASVQLPDTQRNRIRTLGSGYDALAKQLDQCTTRVSSLNAEVDRTRNHIDELPDNLDPTQLRTALQQAMKLGDIEDQLSAIRDEHRRLKEQLDIDLRQLVLWSGTPEELEKLPLPQTETGERFGTNLGVIDQRVRDLRREIQEGQDKAEDLDHNIRRLRLEQDVPTENELDIARARRKQAWTLIRRTWHDGEKLDEEIRDFLNSLGTGDGTLAAGFERSVERADDISDRLRREAGRVATLAELQAQHDVCKERITRLNEQLDQSETQRNDLLKEWATLWEPVGIEPLLPGEMLAWSRQQSGLVQQVQQVRELHGNQQRLEMRLKYHHDDLKKQIEAITGKAHDSAASLVALINEAESVLSSMSEASDTRKHLARDIERLEREFDGARQSLTKAQQNHDEWQAQWKEATKVIPLQPGHGPAEANLLLDLIASTAQQLKDGKSVRSRIAQIDQAITQFAKEVSDLTTRLCPDLTPLPVDQAAAELYARFQKASTAAGKREVLTKQLDDEQENLKVASTTIEDMQGDLAALCSQAGAASADELPQTERHSEEKQKVEKEIENLESQLRRLSAGQTLSDFVTYAQSLDADTLEPRIKQLDQQIDQLNRELRDELGEKIGATREVLKNMDSSAAAADAADDAQDLAARIASDAEEYARLKLASVVLTKAIERYREAHQGPILQRASELFANLSIGSYAVLREDFDEHGRPELFGARAATNELVRVKHMSDGCADQLYLAVRLAWLEHYLAKHETIPFVVDDVLIRFDDDRALATLKALANLSTRTQVLFFTHHRHLVEFARTVIDDDTLFVHELTRFAQLQQAS